MLILSRTESEEVVLTLPDGRRVTVTVVRLDRRAVRLGFHGPRDVVVHRAEIQRLLDGEARATS